MSVCLRPRSTVARLARVHAQAHSPRLLCEGLLPTLLGAVSSVASRVIGSQFLFESGERWVSLKAVEVGAGEPLCFESRGRLWLGWARQLTRSRLWLKLSGGVLGLITQRLDFDFDFRFRVRARVLGFRN